MHHKTVKIDQAAMKINLANRSYDEKQFDVALMQYLNTLLLNPEQDITNTHLEALLLTHDFFSSFYLNTLKLLSFSQTLPASVQILIDNAIIKYYLSMSREELLQAVRSQPEEVFHFLVTQYGDAYNEMNQASWHSQKHFLLRLACEFDNVNLVTLLANGADLPFFYTPPKDTPSLIPLYLKLKDIIREAQSSQPKNEIELIEALLNAYLKLASFSKHKGTVKSLLSSIESNSKWSIDEIKSEIRLIREDACLMKNSTKLKPLFDFILDVDFHWFLAPRINRQLNNQPDQAATLVTVTKHSMFAVEKVDLNEYLARENLALKMEYTNHDL